MARSTTHAQQRSEKTSEFLGILCLALALLLTVSIGTYTPRDPAAFFQSHARNGPTQNFIGPVGAFLAELLVPQLYGVAALLIPLALAMLGWKLFWCRPVAAPVTKIVGTLMLLLSISAFLTRTLGSIEYGGEQLRSGGAIGEILASMLIANFGPTGSHIVIFTCLLGSLLLTTHLSFASLLQGASQRLQSRMRDLLTAWARFHEMRRKERMRREVIRKHAQRSATQEGEAASPRVRSKRGEDTADGMIDLPLTAPTNEARKPLQRELPFVDEREEDEPDNRKPAKRRAGFPLPPTTILDEIKTDNAVDKAHLFEKAKTLQSKTREFGVTGAVVEIHPGPVVTTYEFKPDPGIKYSKIVGLADDLALALEAESIRIDRVSGRSTVGIEIPNEARETISLREILESEVFRKSSGRLTLALGKTVNGDTSVTDLTQMPHLLIAGATGTGKSVGLNCMIASILFRSTPDEVRLILIDPKRLELGVYDAIPHLLTPVVTDPKIAANVLKWAVAEMERRIRLLATEGVRNIEQYNNILKAEQNREETKEDLKPLHYIMIIIDELADLMMVSSNDVEEAITRLAQMARAVGIHLILATQRPSVDVLTGLIKANFPSRISFRVAARVDSRTILDSIGAEHLLGRGDMLFLPPGTARLLRIHGAYVTEHEISRLTSYLRKVARPVYDNSVGKTESRADSIEVDDKDGIFDDAVRFVVQSGQASTSMLQRRFRIGFSRAGRLIDTMERDGIIGPADGSRPREVLVDSGFLESADP
ncbi:MAG: DNA translocase FtsK [Vicinamibacteria bacterium]|nr:DNA translocase FtsK [Vicinamibacteria bacterium]